MGCFRRLDENQPLFE
ncbi:MAG: hypothetical protein LBL04_03675 [Bacteroidales bacterium]|nr:hypothetical protein [Bacteroidales bacterium]